jgi:ATP-dependent Lon protease
VKQGTTAALERVSLTDAAIMEVITHYCGHEAGVRNLKKCLDRVFRKVTAKLEAQEAEIVQESGVTEY